MHTCVCTQTYTNTSGMILHTWFPPQSLNVELFPFRRDLARYMGVDESDVQVSVLKKQNIWAGEISYFSTARPRKRPCLHVKSFWRNAGNISRMERRVNVLGLSLGWQPGCGVTYLCGILGNVSFFFQWEWTCCFQHTEYQNTPEGPLQPLLGLDQ